MNIDSPWVFGSVAIIGLVLILLAWLGVKLKISKDGASMTRNNNNDIVPPLIPEKYAREIISLVQRTTDFHNSIADLKVGTIRSQMRIYEELELSTISLLRTSFMEITKELELDITTTRKELAAFTITLNSIFPKVKDFVRTSLLNNHYYLMDDDELVKYVRDKQMTIVEIVSRDLDLLWVSDFVNRELIRTIKDSKSPDIADLIKDLYKKSKRVSVENNDLIEKKKEEYNNYVTRMTGVDPSRC